jgi:uncharacterized RDD family membrane protein YckC
MADEGFELICPSCRGAVPSLAQTCPHCGRSMSAPPPLSIDSSYDAEVVQKPPVQPWRAGGLGATPRSYGGFWIRVLASLIDSLLLLAPALVLQRTLGQEAAVFLSWLINWLYYAGLESSGNQATFGKMACGLVVADTDGNRIGFGRATGRNFAKILSAIPLGLGYVMVAWTREKRGLHDFVAGTVVLRP